MRTATEVLVQTTWMHDEGILEITMQLNAWTGKKSGTRLRSTITTWIKW